MARALPILVQVCGALDEAHRAGIIHRDLKPENIFLVQSGAVRDFPKVLDFGLAKVGERQMRPGSVILTQEGMVFGTPEFMSPEQAQGKTLTPASDVYSLAVILYEMLTGKLPFDAKNAMDFIQLHVTGRPVLLNQRVPGRTFPPLLERVLDRALAKRPEDRFASAADFATAMRQVLDGATELHGDVALPPPVLSAVPVGAARGNNVGSSSAVKATNEATSPVGGAARSPSPVALPRASPHSAATDRGTHAALLVAVAVGFMLIGVALALVLMKFVLR
jgi:serine/threonine protein kinase